MAGKGRPRLTQEQYQARLSDYCSRYGVAVLGTGRPPFPAGRRETPQHREWIALYKAHDRLQRRERGQCERCAAPVAEGSVFCEAHRGEPASLAARAREGSCPICLEAVDPKSGVERGAGRNRAVLHRPCSQLSDLAQPLGERAIARLRAFLWPRRSTSSR